MPPTVVHTMGEPPSCNCNDRYYYSSPPPCRSHYYEAAPAVLVPAGPRIVVTETAPAHTQEPKPPEFNCCEFCSSCLGSTIGCAAVCITGILECCCALICGVWRACCFSQPRHRIIAGPPHAVVTAYDPGSYEYDMVIYRRPRRSVCERLLE